MAKTRDDFTSATVTRIARRAGYRCSYPGCGKATVGATSDDTDSINIGTAAHICAAAPGGPRYDATMSPEERSSVRNGMWMCRDHGKAIDSTDSQFTVAQLRLWKQQAEHESMLEVLQSKNAKDGKQRELSELARKIQASAHADLDVFRRTAKWPASSIELTLKVDGFDEPVTTSGLASAIATLDDLILVASPGMGKTTTLFQVAESMLAGTLCTPLFVPLGDWATENATFLASILNRPAYRGISEDDFRRVAAEPGVALLLDGWNELDSVSQNRARVQLTKLKAELPNLGFLITTRKQALDVPFLGLKVQLLSLSEEQQMAIGEAIRGEDGKKVVDHAWRTPGVRELVTNPLYLTALLSLPEGTDFPTTKEEILRGFVATHEDDHANAGALQAVAQGFQGRYLDDLAVFVTRNAGTAVSDDSARRSVAQTSNALAEDGQISSQPQPAELLNVLVSHHVLMRLGEATGYSFQHQQFQEWYASHDVERRIIASAAAPEARDALKIQIFDVSAWEESIFFAVERLARGDTQTQYACAQAILAAFEVDPLLAAEMIFRATDEVWTQVSGTVQDLISRWHAPGKVDRAVRFMLTSGRPEFSTVVWPLISHEDEDVSFSALRNCPRFRISILGDGAEAKIRALSKHIRGILLSEIAMHSGIDGMDFVSAIAKDDPDPEVQASVAESFAFRRADRHVTTVLENANEATFDLVAKKSIKDDISDPAVKKKIDEAVARRAAKGESNAERLAAILEKKDGVDRSNDVANIVEGMELGPQRDADARLIYEAHIQYPEAVVRAILARVQAGKTLFYNARDMLNEANVVLEDENLKDIVLSDTTDDGQAKAAACVLGPIAAAQVLDAFLEVWKQLFPRERADEAARARSLRLETRLLQMPLASLLDAIRERSGQATSEELSEFAELIARRTQERDESVSTLDPESVKLIQAFFVDWATRLLASNASRVQIANVAVLASRAPSVDLLHTLKQMLDNNLERFRAFRAEAEANQWRRCEATDEARRPLTGEYQWAFSAIKSPQTIAMMTEYLQDDHFAETAARVLALHWREVNEPEGKRPFHFGRDFSQVKEKRAVRLATPDATSDAADAIFAAITPRLEDGATSDQKNLAVAMGTIACGLPHGQRNDIIGKLIASASRRPRCSLLHQLVQSGEEIDIKLVIAGIADTFDAAQRELWILTQGDGYELREWLALVPFGSHPIEALDVIRGMPAAQREARYLDAMVSLLAESPSLEAEQLLFALAEDDPRFYARAGWRKAAVQIGTLTSAQRLMDLAIAGTLNGGGVDVWQMGNELAGLLRRHSELRATAYQALQSRPQTPGHALLVRAVVDAPDEEGLMILLALEKDGGNPAVAVQMVGRLVSKQVPSDTWKGAFDVLPVAATSIRKRLLAMTEDGEPTDSAARCLRQIDSMRDELGIPEAEPRHPDLASGKPWPILRPDPDA